MVFTNISWLHKFNAAFYHRAKMTSLFDCVSKPRCSMQLQCRFTGTIIGNLERM